MPREHARIRLDMLNDPDYRALPHLSQHIYNTALMHPLLSNAGVVPYTAKRWALHAADLTPNRVRSGVATLEEHRFVIVDLATEELFVRSFVKHDGLIWMPNVAKNMALQARIITSPRITYAFLAELHRLHRNPDYAQAKGWEQQPVIDLLAEPFPEGLPEGFTEPFRKGLPEGFTEGLRKPLSRTRDAGTRDRAYAAPAPAPSPAPAPDPPKPAAAAKPIDPPPPPGPVDELFDDLGPWIPGVRQSLHREVDLAQTAGATIAHCRVGLVEWSKREGATPKLLGHLIGDAMRASQSASDNPHDEWLRT